MTLKFSPGNHQYRLDGKHIPGVTTLIGKGLPKDALVYWSAKAVAEYVADNEDGVTQLRAMGRGPMVNALKGVPWESRDKAAVKGTDVHALAEQVVHGAEVEVPPDLVDHVTGYATWLDEFDVTPVLTERSCANRTLFYAGRFDLIADIAGTRWMLDVKTGGVYADAALQLDAYRNTEFYVQDDDPDTELPLPEHVERLGVIHVTDAGTTLYPMRSDGEPFRIFKHVMYVAKRRKDIDAFKFDPITSPEELRHSA
jgi:hypothetical protein